MTVVANTAVEAEVLAQGGLPRRARRRRPAVLVTNDGRTVLAGRTRVKSDPTFWLLARATGLTAYVLLTTSVLAGLTVKARPLGRRIKAAAATDLHRFLSLLALGAIALHGLALDARPDRPDAARRAARPRAQPIPAARDRASACSPRS